MFITLLFYLASNNVSMKTCLCCLSEEENGVDICKSCSEGWVCKECLEEYRKHWGQQCCICRQGIRNSIVLEESVENHNRNTILTTIFYYIILIYALLIPGVSCYFWLEYPMGDSDDIQLLIAKIVIYESIVIFLNVYGNLKSREYMYLILFNTWVFLGNCIYVAFFHIAGIYGNFIFYLMFAFMGCLIFVIPGVVLFCIYDILVKSCRRATIRIIPEPMDVV